MIVIFPEMYLAALFYFTFFENLVHLLTQDSLFENQYISKLHVFTSQIIPLTSCKDLQRAFHSLTHSRESREETAELRELRWS